MQTSDRRTISSLCREAAAGELSIDRLWQSVPDYELHPVLRQIVDDLEDAVEHTPGKHGAVDWIFWRRTRSYRTLIADGLLLESDADLDRVHRIRDVVLARMPDSIPQLEQTVHDLLEDDKFKAD